jgi:5-methylcytosine-specific restriction endonuclease McrA
MTSQSRNKLTIVGTTNVNSVLDRMIDPRTSNISDIFLDITDDKSVISDITNSHDGATVSSAEILQKVEDIRLKTETELSKLTMEELRDKCKDLSIGNLYKMKKPDLVDALLSEFMKLWQPTLKDKKLPELKSICKSFDIKGITGLRRDELSLLIFNYCSENMKFRLDDSSPVAAKTDAPIVQEEKTSTKSKKTEPKKLSAFEELEKQKLEIESKMKEELERQKKIVEEEIRKKQEEEQRLIEEEKKKEKEEAKKKKQAIPKHVRTIVWNHYIGEDIIKHKCLCCKKVTITNTCFEVGHVLSEKNGGTHEINNLRPICGACNHSMGTENMVDYVVKYGLFIG